MFNNAPLQGAAEHPERLVRTVLRERRHVARLKAQVAVLNADRSRRITERTVSRPASTRGAASPR